MIPAFEVAVKTRLDDLPPGLKANPVGSAPLLLLDKMSGIIFEK
jgi:hypothetical protein